MGQRPPRTGRSAGPCKYWKRCLNFNGTGNYLTASVTAHNTGNISTIVRIKVARPLQGFHAITKVKKVHTAAGSSKQVRFRAPVNEQQVSQFQGHAVERQRR